MGFSHGARELIAASQTDQICGEAGAKGDIIERLIIVPATIAPGAVDLQDADGSAFSIFAGTAGWDADLRPLVVELGMVATGATTPGWKVTTGANVSVIAIGQFS